MKRIAVLTSGGDAPGMNAAIRAVTRTAIDAGIDVLGVHQGYQGLIDGDMAFLTRRDVGGIMQSGGTVLGSARCPAFETVAGREVAIRNMAERDVEALVVIGGNGSQTGSHALSQMGFPSSASPRRSTTTWRAPTSPSAWIRRSTWRSRRSTGSR